MLSLETEKKEETGMRSQAVIGAGNGSTGPCEVGLHCQPGDGRQCEVWNTFIVIGRAYLVCGYKKYDPEWLRSGVVNSCGYRDQAGTLHRAGRNCCTLESRLCPEGAPESAPANCHPVGIWVPCC